jgi:hypothetical protein
MGNLGKAFDFSKVPQSDRGPMSLLPSGLYIAHIIEGSVVPAKSGRGLVANLMWEILDGPHERRRVWSRVNVENENETAQEIGQRFMGMLQTALGIEGLVDSTDVFLFQAVEINVGVEKSRDPQYPDRNMVKSIRPVPGVSRAAAPAARLASPASTARPASVTQPARRPWEKPKVDDEIPF